MGDLILAQEADLQAPTPDAELVAVSIGPASQALALWADDSNRRLVTTQVGGEVAAVVPIRDSIEVRYPRLQPLPDGHILIADSRWRSGSPANAWVYSGDGTLLTAGGLGDAIEHLLVDANGEVWVGYFDEGVFGGYKHSDHGLARFTTDLQATWTYPFDAEFGDISDCYVLNVDGEVAWAYYYTNFPIVRIEQDVIGGWATNVAGAKGLLVRDTTVALVGTYDNPHQVTRGSLLSDGRFEEGATGELNTESRDFESVRGRQAWFCRGASLHVFVEQRRYRADL